jgi:penicillin-binding protein 2
VSSLQPPDDRRLPITPQLAMRVAILGGIALALFGIVFFRLWFLQVLSGDEYLAQAAGNRVRSLQIAAPRGEMVDRNGQVLVENRRAVAVVVSPPKLPTDAGERAALLNRLSRVLGIARRPERCTVGDEVLRIGEVDCAVRKGIFQLPYADVTVKTDVSPAVYSFLAERHQEFPGVSIQQVFLRSYPFREIGAQLFGTIGQIDEQQLREDHYRGVRGGTLVGKSGLEYTYDRYLRGRDGATRVQVDSMGRATGDLEQRDPEPGANLRLSLDLGLQRAGQAALGTGIGLANGLGNPAAGGAFVALDPRNGEVLAMGSAPSFDPNLLTRPISERVYEEQLGEARNYPQINRAIAGAYPVGSTFKVVTAAAALATGIITASTPYTDDGSYEQGALVRRNAGGAVYGTVALRDALKVSVDTYFYWLGERMNADPAARPGGGPLQAWARRFGFGAPTGIDIGGEISGTIPSPRWRDERNHEQAACERDHRRHRDPARRRYKGVCAYADGTDRPWSVGDNSSLAVGQGDFLATPLQLAVSYAALQNGGTVVRPHVGLEITDPVGRVLQRIDPKPARRIDIPDLATIQDALHASTSEGGGTSVDVFAGFPHPVYGKTGTAEHYGRPDQSWYAAYVPDPVRPIVVAATIESGGFGAESAAPVVRLILSQWFGAARRVVVGSSRTN